MNSRTLRVTLAVMLLSELVFLAPAVFGADKELEQVQRLATVAQKARGLEYIRKRERMRRSFTPNGTLTASRYRTRRKPKPSRRGASSGELFSSRLRTWHLCYGPRPTGKHGKKQRRHCSAWPTGSESNPVTEMLCCSAGCRILRRFRWHISSQTCLIPRRISWYVGTPG